ncbi:MAG: T9SS type A sorting domain-containing protein [Ignavibacteria bacterium]
MSQNYPNPFNPVTNLEFGIAKLGFVSLKIYDVLGRELVTLVNEIKDRDITKLNSMPAIFQAEFIFTDLW